MSTSPTLLTALDWPIEVADFAAKHEAGNVVEQLRQALDRLFPGARSMSIHLEEDPEIRDDCHVVFEVRVSRADVPNFAAAKRLWHEELFRLCPALLVDLFRLTLIRVAP